VSVKTILLHASVYEYVKNTSKTTIFLPIGLFSVINIIRVKRWVSLFGPMCICHANNNEQ